MRMSQMAKDIVTDVAFALRSFRRSPGWTLVALLTIALGVGASTTVFSVADRFLIRPLAYRDASHVYVVSLVGTMQGEPLPLRMPARIVREWLAGARTIDAAVPYGGTPPAFLHGDLNDVNVTTSVIGDGFLPFTGARPLIGRNFTTEETAPNGPPAIMLAEGFWRRQFGGSADVLGKVVRLAINGDSGWRPSTIVGVVPASLALPEFRFSRPEIWLPLTDSAETRIAGIAVRLKPGQPPSAAREEVTGILERTHGISPDFVSVHPRIRVSRPQDDLPFRQALLLLTGAVLLLLLIACSNVSHLLLQRGLTRERELAVRHALGAGRGRLVRQLVTESTLLALAGGGLAMLVASAGLNGLMRLRPADLPALSYLSPTRGVVPLAAGLAIVVGLAVGVLGAVHIAHGHLAESLTSGASSAPRRHRRLRASLVIGQFALSAMLLVGAILLVRVVVDLERERLGFASRDLYAVSFQNLYAVLHNSETPLSVTTFAATVRDMAAHTLGTRDVTIAGSALPDGYTLALAAETADHIGEARPPVWASENYVAPDYFSALRMPLIFGRPFDEVPLSLNEVIVSRALAQLLWHDDNVVGRQFRNTRKEGGLQEWVTVVGVAPDILTNRLDRESRPTLYRPFPGGAIATSLIVRLPRMDAGEVLRHFATSVQPDPLRWRVLDVNERVEQSTAQQRFVMAVLLLFAWCGVLLAAIGLFGVVSYAVSQRTREIGVRMTLGATRGDIVGLLLRGAMGEVALGMGVGLVGAVVVTRLARTMVYGVHGIDAITFILAAVSVLLASMVACAEPLFRATRVDPAVAIRGE
jgi:putative ABC transport system permease protein